MTSRLFTTYKKVVVSSARHAYASKGAGEYVCLRKLYLESLEAAVVQWDNGLGTLRFLVLVVNTIVVSVEGSIALNVA